MAYARRHHQELTLVRIEIDDLRTIFLQRGKETAERLLLHVSRLLRATIRKEDTAGRITLGGFALSLPAGEQQGIERMVGRVRAELVKPWVEIIGDAFPLKFSAAVLRPPLETGLSAQDALDQCQAKLAVVGEPQAARPEAIPPARPVPAAAATPPSQSPRPSVLIDPLLEQIERGNPQPALAGMPLVLRRLLPLLRLLNATQRDTLMRFLQQLK
jgi:GGDEF domain-containing protein